MLLGTRFEAEDLTPLSDFSERWRWTDPAHDLLPQDALDTIQPVSAFRALDVWNAERRFLDVRENSLSRDFFTVERFPIPQEREGAKRWLARRLVPATERVVICYGQETAVITTAETFVNYWDSFCYPSDDVTVWPLTQCWALLHHHTEVFHYGIWRLD